MSANSLLNRLRANMHSQQVPEAAPPRVPTPPRLRDEPFAAPPPYQSAQTLPPPAYWSSGSLAAPEPAAAAEQITLWPAAQHGAFQQALREHGRHWVEVGLACGVEATEAQAYFEAVKAGLKRQTSLARQTSDVVPSADAKLDGLVKMARAYLSAEPKNLEGARQAYAMAVRAAGPDRAADPRLEQIRTSLLASAKSSPELAAPSGPP
jgi:hypothetical protein